MKDEKLIVLLSAFRYAVHRIPTQALREIQNELFDNLHKMPDWMLTQMERDIEWNFELMQSRLEETGRISLDDDCRFQKPLLDAVKAQRAKLAEIARGTTNGNMLN